MSSCPYLAAMCNGVFSEVELWTLGLHLSSVMRYPTISTLPHWHARWSRLSPSSLSGISWAVSPFLLGMLVLHLLSRRSMIICNNLKQQAICRGVLPSLFWAFELDWWWSNSLEIATVSLCLTAKCKGASPSLFWGFGSHSLYDNSWTIMSSCPYLAAMCNGVFSEVELWTLGLHLSSVMRYPTISTLPHWHARWSRLSPSSLSGISWAVSPFLLGMLVLHLLSRRSMIICNNLKQQAICRGVLPSLFWAFELDWWWSNSLEIATVSLCLTAKCKGASPSLFWGFGSHSLYDNSWTIVPYCPYLAAKCRGVSPSLFCGFGSHSLYDNSWTIVPSCPYLAAKCRGVSPSLFWAFGLHLLCDNSWTIVFFRPYLAAMCNGVFSEVELWTLGSHLSLVMRYLTISALPHWHAIWRR